MCLQIRVATDEPLAPPYAPEVGGLGVRALPPAEAGVFRVFSKPHVHEVTMQGACGCEFRHPGGAPREGLVWLLAWALRRAAEAELYVCWPDAEGAEPAIRDWSTAAELLHWRVFEGGELLVVVHPDAESGVR